MSQAKYREYRRNWMREWRRKNPERARAIQRKHWVIRKRYLRRLRAKGTKRCEFCGVLLSAKSVGLKCQKYCDWCKKQPQIWKKIRSIYMRRWYAKKVGNPLPPIEFEKVEI